VAFPAEDNYAGVKYPLEWINYFKHDMMGTHQMGKWLVLVDAG